MTEDEEKRARAELKRVATKLSAELIPALETLLLQSKPGERSVLIGDWPDVTSQKGTVKLDGRITVLGPVDSKLISNIINDLIGDPDLTDLDRFVNLNEKTPNDKADTY